jgi:hypothetical protein
MLDGQNLLTPCICGRISMKSCPCSSRFPLVKKHSIYSLYYLFQHTSETIFWSTHLMGSLPIDCIQEGRNTIWPHNPQTGWSYCVMIPSWITQTPETGVTADSFLKSVVVSIVYLVCFFISPIFFYPCHR